MIINSEIISPHIKLGKQLPATGEKFESLLDPLKSFEEERPKNPPCHFDMFVVRKKNQPLFINGKREWCHRGDKYSLEEYKMLRYLVGIIKNHIEKHSLMQLHDNTVDFNKRIIFKSLHREVKINRLPYYSKLLAGFPMPEYLSCEINN